MNALENLLLEVEKHGAMRGHAKLMAEAREELEQIKKSASVTVCAYCGHEILKSDGARAVIDHIANCEKRPEKTLLDKAFEVENKLCGWLRHLTEINDGEPSYQPRSPCETCHEIEEALRIYNSVEE